jgi:hypothetical protein
MWVKTTPSITSSYQCFFYEGVPGEYHMASGATGVFGLLEVGVKGSNNSWQGVYFNLNNSINVWQHFVFNYSNNVIDLYINGQFFGSASNTSGGIWSPTLDQTNFGARRVTGSVEYPFNGSLDDIGIWNRALTPSEITALYQSQNCNLSVTSTQNNITLNGGNNGSASVNVSGGTAPYTYSWSPSGGTNSNATGLTAGSYTCNITDANSCSTSTVVTITQPAPTSNCFPSYVPANGLVGWWPFCGNANDESGNGHNGIVNGATATVDRFGNVGQAYNFDGVNDRISINHNASFNFTNNLTVSIWSKVSNFGPNNQWLIDKGLDASPGLYNWGIASIAPGNFVSLAVTNTGDYTSTTAAASNTGIWNMWTYVYDGASIKLYKNDSIVINAPANGNLKTNTEPISVGYFPHANMPPYGYFYNGQLDDIGIWNRVLTACEINQLYTSGVSPIVASSTSSTICAGANSTLTANGATSYTWMPGNFTSTSIAVSPSVNTTYTVTGTNANGCSNAATVNVNVNALPVVTAASSASAVCAGNSVTLSGGGASTYNWSNGVTNAISFVPTNSSTYTVTGTDLNGCSKTATTSVLVNSLPIVTAASSASAVCAGNSVTVSGGGASTYVWSNVVTNAVSFIPTTNTTYTVTGTDANGCSKTATTSVLVNSLPIVTAVSSATAVCAGNSVTLSGGGASTYVWSNGVTNAISFVPTNSSTYTVTGTDLNGCSKTATTNVVVNALPVVTAASSASAVCAGNSVSLSGGGASSYVWSNGVTDAVSFVPTNSATYTVTGTNANGCINTATTNVVVNTLPIVTAASSASALCAGNSVTLSGGGASSYVWSSGVTNAISFIPTNNATYTVTGTDANGCSNTATISVTINPLPIVTAASSASAVCAGNSVTLSGGGASTYSWSSGVTNAVSFVPTSNATYTVTGTDANGCSNTATTNIVVNTLPIVTAASSASVVCAGNSATLSGGGASVYVWSDGVTNAVSFMPTTNTTYTVTGTDANGCVNTATTSLVINALPVVTTVSSASVICAGGGVTLSGGGASTYVWSDGVTDAVSFIPTSNTTYTVTGTDGNGCVNTASTSVVLNSLPVVTAASSASAVCAGNSVTLSGGGASSYVWSNGVTNAISFIPTINSTYTVTGTDANGCSKTATTNVVVNTLPIVTAASSASAVCAGSSVTLSGGGASSYVWSSGVTNAISFVPTTNTTYTVTGTDGNGCSNTAATSIVVNELPIILVNASSQIYCLTDLVGTLSANPTGGFWSGTGITGNSFDPSLAGFGIHNSIYSYTDVNGCINSDTLIMSVNLCTGVNEITTENLFTVYPNPVTTEINIKADVSLIGSVYTIYDNKGKLVLTGKINSENTLIELGNLSGGIYLLNVGDKTTRTFKVVKE